MRVYLAGPMRGCIDHNFPAFHAAAARLRAEGHEVFNPAENDERMAERGEDITIRNCLRIDLEWICANAEAVALMPGWRDSKGAAAEHATALAIGIDVIELSADGATLTNVLSEVGGEVARAEAAWPPMNSAHEGWAVIYEEFIVELGAHVWTGQKKRDLKAMRQEAIQVAAMAVRFVRDVVDGGRGRK